MIIFNPKLIRAKALNRRKRFTVKAELESGHVVDVYCPNTGPMTGVFEDGGYCWIQPRSGGKMPYVMRIMEADGTLVGIDTQIPNILVKAALQSRTPTALMDALPKFQSYESEVGLKPSWRVDFVLSGHDQRIPLEVKNVIWKPRDDMTAFPDTITSRGQKHITNLTEFAERNGIISIILYVVQRSDCKGFAVSQLKDLKYWQLIQNNRHINTIIMDCDVQTTHISLRNLLHHDRKTKV